MNRSELEFYRCPLQLAPLALETADPGAASFDTAELVSPDGRRHPVRHGIPDLVYPQTLCDQEARTQESYDLVAERIYDAAVDWQFAAVMESEDEVREMMVDLLQLTPGQRVLEIGCGTGRDSFRLARRLGPDGALFMQDLSPKMVYHCRAKMGELTKEHGFTCDLHYFISNASYLPFPDGFFDAVFHFGGFNEFGEQERAAREFARVTRQGGRVLFGDESVAPWLRGTEFEGIVTTNNPLFRHPLPIQMVPECAREVQVRWVMGNCFYVIAFTKGDGPPPLNLDLPHAGRRGGTLRTRYFGQIEGVTPEAKKLAIEAAAASGLSVHEWLDRLVRAGAQSTTDDKQGS